MMGGLRVSRKKRTTTTTRTRHDHHENEDKNECDIALNEYQGFEFRFFGSSLDTRGMQHQLRSAIYRPILKVMTLARAAGWRPRCRRQGRNGRPTWVILAACAVRPLRG
jgi:hypothetical protein